MSSSLPLITLDGPAGVGKSTLALRLAELYGIPCLNTGAMFRSLALRLEAGTEDLPEEEIRARCDAFSFSLEGSGGKTVLRCNGEVVGEETSGEEVGARASRLAVILPVRESLKAAQRRLGEAGPLVAEGRDMGSEIFPNARFKFFVDAPAGVRARRRYDELKAQGRKVSLTAIAMDMRLRDEQDRSRRFAPLRRAADAVLVDTSERTVDEVVDFVRAEIESRGGMPVPVQSPAPEAEVLHLAGMAEAASLAHSSLSAEEAYLKSLAEEEASEEISEGPAESGAEGMPTTAAHDAKLAEMQEEIEAEVEMEDEAGQAWAQAEAVMESDFSHIREDGGIRMVDVGGKERTERVAIVRCEIRLNAQSLERLKARTLPKGDALATAQVAGILAAKRTADLIPLCHPLPLSFADVRFSFRDEPPAVLVEAEARTTDRTGVEMEALIAAQTAAATIYDMCKAVQRDIEIDRVRLVYKSGGRSGVFDRRES